MSPVQQQRVEGEYLQDVGDDPNGPAIHCLAVGLLCQYLRGWRDSTVRGDLVLYHRDNCPVLAPPRLTHIAGCPTGGGHDTATALNLGEPEVADHDLGVLLQAVVQQVLGLQEG